MRIAIHAADLDHNRIDGTRVYILNMLKNFGELSKTDKFYIYHQSDFNPHLAPPVFSNYEIKKIPFPRFWTQTRFALQLFFDKPDVLWMPVHNIPRLRRKKMKVVVTIHDLAFKIYPQYFPKKDLRKLNKLTNYAVKNADKIIAISEITKKDILKFYPEVHEKRISVIHHGFDAELFQQKNHKDKSKEIFDRFKIKKDKFILYVGAIQPRKNLEVLIDAFDAIKKIYPDLKLVFAGAPAWNYKKTLDRISNSPFKKDIIVTGTLPFDVIVALFHGSKLFVFPSINEGFGIPVLEAFAAGTPAVVARNSSLVEVGGDAAIFFETGNSNDLTEKIKSVIEDQELREKLVNLGLERVQNFTWQKCAKLTLDFIKKK